MSPVIADWAQLEASVESLSKVDRLRLIEVLSRSLRAPTESDLLKQSVARRAFMDELAALPVVDPADGFSNRQHDAVLYGARP